MSCIRDGILADFLTKHKAEVMDVVLTEYDEEKHMKMIARDAKADGMAIGEKNGMAKGEKIGMAKGEKIGMAKGEIMGAIKVFRMNPDLSDREIADKIAQLFSISEDEALEKVQMYK